MRWAIESWAPEYGSSMDAEGMDTTGPEADPDVEVPAAQWAPVSPTATTPAKRVLFVDGVRRIDARVWATTTGGETRAGIAASYAAGVVCCDGTAQLRSAQVGRGVFSSLAEADPLVTRCGTYTPMLADGDSVEQLVAELQQQMRALERATAAAVGTADLVVVDGPLSRPAVAGAVGYVKTHHRSYLSPELSAVVGRLAPGQRTPLFRTVSREPRFAWYARLPGGDGHPWAGVVRGETPGDLPLDRVRLLADLATVTWPRFASVAHKDPRAPQNLHPIAELERALRRRLGDAALLYRSLRLAAYSAGSNSIDTEFMQ